eukprot:743804-Rhodomonas_salina.1
MCIRDRSYLLCHVRYWDTRCYAMSGTRIRAAMPCPVLGQALLCHVRYWDTAAYAMPGTERGRGGRRRR